MEYIAQSKYVRASPRKIRVVAGLVKKLSLTQAMQRLELLAKSGAQPLLKTLKSAVANAAQNGKAKAEDLKIKNILIDEGIRAKRRDTSHGARFMGGVIQKQTSHIKVILEG